MNTFHTTPDRLSNGSPWQHSLSGFSRTNYDLALEQISARHSLLLIFQTSTKWTCFQQLALFTKNKRTRNVSQKDLWQWKAWRNLFRWFWPWNVLQPNPQCDENFEQIFFITGTVHMHPRLKGHICLPREPFFWQMNLENRALRPKELSARASRSTGEDLEAIRLVKELFNLSIPCLWVISRLRNEKCHDYDYISACGVLLHQMPIYSVQLARPSRTDVQMFREWKQTGGRVVTGKIECGLLKSHVLKSCFQTKVWRSQMVMLTSEAKICQTVLGRRRMKEAVTHRK